MIAREMYKYIVGAVRKPVSGRCDLRRPSSWLLVPVSKRAKHTFLIQRNQYAYQKHLSIRQKRSEVIELQSCCVEISAKGGVPGKPMDALTDEQVKTLVDTVKTLPPYVFVMLGLYAGSAA